MVEFDTEAEAREALSKYPKKRKLNLSKNHTQKECPKCEARGYKITPKDRKIEIVDSLGNKKTITKTKYKIDDCVNCHFLGWIAYEKE